MVVVSGTNEEMGYQYACQVPDLIYRNSVLLKSKVEAQYGAELAKTDMQVWSYYADKVRPGLRQGRWHGRRAWLKTAIPSTTMTCLPYPVYSG